VGTLVTFFAEARRRRVFRSAGMYVVGAWVLIQVADVALESLELPAGLLRYFWLAAFAGLPLALIFSWYYEVSADGIRKTVPSSPDETRDLSLKVPDYVLIVALAIVAGLVTAGLLERARTSEALSVGGIAVLPLENLTGDADQNYFSAGMHDALITSLSKISALRVVSRTSTLRLDETLTIPQIGDALGVGHVIEGSVTREGDRVRIIVQLIDSASDAHVWAESFERELTSVLSLQNELAVAIAEAVDIQLSDEEQAQFSSADLVDPELYDAYLRGMHLINQENVADRQRGITMLEDLVAKDPTNARAYAGLAYGYAMLGHDPVSEGVEPASKLAAARALELDDGLAEAHLSLGTVKLYFSWDIPGAEASLRRAIELNPNLSDAYLHYGYILELYGPSEAARAAGVKGARLDPLSPLVLSNVGAQFLVAGLYDEALEYFDQTLRLDPGNAFVRWLQAMTYADMGDFEHAHEVAEQIRTHPAYGFAYGVVLAKAGKIEEAREELAAIEEVPANVVGLILLNAALGNGDEAFRWLRQARDMRLAWYPWFLVWFPELEPFRRDPRMRELAAEIGMEDYL
jgi:TolB-like protein/Tfp pilus assembly protein PilF